VRTCCKELSRRFLFRPTGKNDDRNTCFIVKVFCQFDRVLQVINMSIEDDDVGRARDELLDHLVQLNNVST